MENFARYLHKHYTISSKGEIKKANGHVASVEEVFKAYREVQENAGYEVTIKEDDIRAYVKDNTPKEESGDEFSLHQFIEDYLAKFAAPNSQHPRLWRIGPAWRTIERMGSGVPVPSDIRQLQVAIRAYALKCGINKGAKLDDIKCILEDKAADANDSRVFAIVQKIRHNPESVGIAYETLAKLHEFWKISQSFEVFYALVMHWMWQVKRKLLGLNTVWALWINFFGGTAIGKTSFLNALSEPFEDFALITSISKLLDDERQMVKLTASYIINLDELSVNNRESLYADKEGQMGRDQQATLKSLLTQTKMQTRLMGGQSQTTRRLTFSCCSSANEHLYDIIYDERTMRRYFEFDCGVDKVDDFSVMDEIKTHILDLWKAVDETREDGYWHPKCAVWNEVAKEQSKYYPTNTTTGMWINDSNVVAGTASDHEAMQDLYDEYKSYCKERGHMNKSYGKWSTDIEHLVEGAKQGNHLFIKILPKTEVECE